MSGERMIMHSEVIVPSPVVHPDCPSRYGLNLNVVCVMVNGTWKYLEVVGRNVPYEQLVAAAEIDARFQTPTVSYVLPNNDSGDIIAGEDAPIVGGAVYNVLVTGNA